MSEFLVSLNPLNQEPVGQVPITSRSELTEIVGRSRIAQANWGRLSLEERATRLRDAYHALASAQNQLARLITLELSTGHGQQLAAPCPDGGQQRHSETLRTHAAGCRSVRSRTTAPSARASDSNCPRPSPPALLAQFSGDHFGH